MKKTSEQLRARKLIKMLKGREKGAQEYILKAAAQGSERDRIYYVGYQRGLESGRELIEQFFLRMPPL